MIDMFATAPTTPTKAAEKKAKKSKPELTIGRNLDVLAAADAIAKSMKGVIDAYGSMIKGSMTKHFATEGSTLGRRPENVSLTGDHSTASGELRKRDERRVLIVEEAEKLEAAGVVIEEKEIEPERFYFDNEILSDPEYRAKVSAALSLIDFGGKSPIVKQERVVAKVVSEESIQQAFVGKTADEAEQLLQIVGTLAIKPKFNGTLAEASEILTLAGVTI